MKIIKIITDSKDSVLGLGDDNKMYLWDASTTRWELLQWKED